MKTFIRLCLIAFLGAGLVAVACSGGGDCKEDKDCTTAGQTCQGGKCTNSSNGDGVVPGDGGGVDKAPKPCAKDAECQDTEYCKDKTCQLLPAKCTADTECRLGLKCLTDSGQCVTPCSFDENCPADQACDTDKKHCIPVKKCEKAEDCEQGQTCNTCRKICTKSVGQTCNEDFNCTDLGGSDNAWCDKCVNQCRKRLTVCEPCTKHEQCGGEKDLCLPDLLNPESGKKYCAKACSQGLCPAQYVCKKFTDPDLSSSPEQCIPASNDCANPSQCQSNADCIKEGKICDVAKGLCIPGCEVDENCPIKTAEDCTKKEDCKNPNAVCSSGKCSIQQKCCRGRCGSPCQSDSECEAQETCDSGCCKVKDECRTNKDCPKAQTYCDVNLGKCVDGCQTADDCGATDPQKPRCRWKCTANKCEEDCSCRDPNLDCTAVRFCPLEADVKKDPLAPCRKPIGPTCQSCSSSVDCGCKQGDDCKFICTKKECQQDSDCAGLAGGANTCYNGRCSSKKACRSNADCPNGEKCENSFCAENCNNICLNLQTGARCFPGCDPTGDGAECPSRLSCIELLPQSASGPKCKGSGVRCKQDTDCKGDTPRCGEDGYCTDCSAGKVCRGLDQMDPTNLICINMPPTVCAATGGDVCKEGGF